MKYPVGTKIACLTPDVDAYGVVITPEELMEIAPKFYAPGDVCVKWLNPDGTLNCASTYDERWLGQNAEVSFQVNDLSKKEN
jgi:hypothetical protein